MSALGALLVVLSLWLWGRALLPARTRVSRARWEEQAVAYLIGAALLPLLAMALAWIGLGFSTTVAWILLGAGLVLGSWRVWRDRADACAPAELGRGAALLLGSLAVGSIAVTLAFPLNEFDPILHFAYKGKLLASLGDPADPAFTAVAGEVGRIQTHPNYPLGVPFLEAFAARAGGWSDRWVQLPLAFWSACLPGAVAFGLRGISSRAARLGACVAAATPMLYASGFLAEGWSDLAAAGLGEGKMLGGRGDLPLAAMMACGCALVVRARQTNSLPAALAAGVCLAGGAFMKNEGLALLGVASLGWLGTLGLERGRRAPLMAAVLAVSWLALAPWLIHRGGLPAIDENYGEQLNWERVSFYLSEPEPTDASPIRPELYGPDWTEASPYRVPRIARYFGAEIVDLLSWGLLWILALWSLPWGRRLRDADARWLAWILVGGFALYAMILLVTPWFLPALHRKDIPARLLLHLVGPAALLIGARLGRDGARIE